MNYNVRRDEDDQNYYGPGSRKQRWQNQDMERGIGNNRAQQNQRGYDYDYDDRERNFRQDGNSWNESDYGNRYRGEDTRRSQDLQEYRNQPADRDYRDGNGRSGNNPSYQNGGYSNGRNSNTGYSNGRNSNTRNTASSRQYQNRNQPEGKDNEGLRKLLLDQLKDMLWAEKELTKAIPAMIEKATSEDLIESLRDHLEVTKDQVFKVKEAFKLMDEKPSAKVCEAMKGLVKEAEEIMKEMEEGSVRDAAIICAAQKVEHYEIATYGCLSTYAQILGETEVANLLEEILSEEKEADDTLTDVAYAINWEAKEEEVEEEEDEEEEEESEEEEDDHGDTIQAKKTTSLWRTKHSKNPKGK
jgi:ferritin-like metal-binding protein YciE